MVGFEAGDEIVQPMAGRNCERSDEVDPPRVPRRGEVRQGHVRSTRWLDHLLPQRVDRPERPTPNLVGVELDVVADAIGGPEADRRPCQEEPLRDDPIEEGQGVAVERRGCLAHLRVGKDRRVLQTLPDYVLADMGLEKIEFRSAADGRRDVWVIPHRYY